MFLVALTTVPQITDGLVRDVAVDIGLGAYDARMLLSGGAPCILLTTPDEARATTTARRFQARGLRGVMIDDSAVCASDAMVALRRFRFEPSALVLEDGAGETLPFDDVHAMVRAFHRTSHVTRDQKTKTSVHVAAALVTGVVVVTRKTTETVSRSDDKEQVLYLFRRSGQTPWIVRESQVAFTALGAAMGPTRPQNFLKLTAELRARMHQARFDERLVTGKRVGERQVDARAFGANGRSASGSSEWGTDLLAHLVALSLAQEAPSPYRQ